MKKDVVAGIGEIGNPILKLLSKQNITVGFDLNPDLMDKRKFERYKNLKTSFLHITIPVTSKFFNNILDLYKKFLPECIVIHSTIKPTTTFNLQQKLSVPVIYSATRGVHKRMLSDMKRYTKFFAIEDMAPNKKWACKEFAKLLKISNIKSKQISSPITLELAKIVCDTSYYGWLINYAQMSKMIAKKYKVDYDEMRSFSDEIHKFLGNRPKMFPGFIGGHCVIPNLQLIDEHSLNQINDINNIFKKFLKK